MKVTYRCTHKGWFGICPVYLADLHTQEPFVEERHGSLAWLLAISEIVYSICFLVMELMDPLAEPAWPLRITGKLAVPKVITHEHDDATNG